MSPLQHKTPKRATPNTHMKKNQAIDFQMSPLQRKTSKRATTNTHMKKNQAIENSDVSLSPVSPDNFSLQ